MVVNKISLKEKFAAFQEHWSPKVVGELNGQYVKVVKFLGEYVWHLHAGEDELFWVVAGRMRIEFRDQTVSLEEGELVIVPRGVEHKPVADQECQVVLFEPSSTRNTGNVDHAYTIEAADLERL